MKKFSFWLLLAMAIALLGSLSAVGSKSEVVDRSEPTATISTVEVMGACSTVWLTYPSYYNEFSTGSKKCLTLKKSDWIPVRNSAGVLIDYVSPYGYTRVAPHNGDGSKTASTIKALGTKYGVKVQFANVDLLNRPGCNTKGFPTSVSGTYTPSSSKPGKGLVRLGTGTKKACIAKYATKNINIAKHEISHGIIERKCKGKSPFRGEQTADAYAWKFLKASSKSAGNYGFSDKDLERAVKIHRGFC